MGKTTTDGLHNLSNATQMKLKLNAVVFGGTLFWAEGR